MKESQVRDEPRLSLNALAEYLTASAGRRRTIVSEQKRPKTFQVAYYGEAGSAITSSLVSRADEGALDRALDRIRTMPVKKTWDIARRETLTEAIEAFRAMLVDGLFPRLPQMRPSPKRTQALSVNGVSVSVRPELLAQSENGPATGGVKLYFSKATPLADDRARYASALLHMYFESLAGGADVADSRHCFVLDVLGRRLHGAPRTFRRRREDIGAACAEIAALWDGV